MYDLPAAWQGGKCQADAVSSEMQTGVNTAAILSIIVEGDSGFVPQADPKRKSFLIPPQEWELMNKSQRINAKRSAARKGGK